METSKKDLPKGIRFYSTKKGNFWSTKLNQEDLAILLDQAAEGGKITLTVLDEASRKSEKSPNAYLNFLSAGQVADMDAKYQASKTASPGRSAPRTSAPVRQSF